jgi:hypothetical protein
MPPLEPVAAGRVSLVDAVDHLLNRGAVLVGDATLSVAGIDLVYVGLNLLVSSVETMRQRGDWSADGAPALPPAPDTPAPSAAGGMPAGLTADPRTGPAPELSLSEPDAPANQLRTVDGPGIDNGDASRSLARLVLALVELLRQLVERQALRRVEGDGLTEEQVERMGRGLMELAEKMAELRTVFGLEEEDLSIDLGPLGRLL